MSLRVAVMAGTPVDTQMGVCYLNEKNKQANLKITEAFYYPVSESCDAQIKFQYGSDEEKEARIDHIFDDAVSKGIQDFFIYCNSISGAFDFDAYTAKREVHVYTPLHIYAELADQYKSTVGVITANNLSAYKIEDVIMRKNPDIYVLATGNMQLVSAIEAKRSPGEIIERLGIKELIRFYEKSRCECLILGCTHFPYLKDELKRITDLPIVDPAEKMFEKLISNKHVHV